jgi:hypothetical protein
MEKKLQEEIAKVAYDLHQKRGMVHGSELLDWLEAERIVLARYEKGAEKENSKKPPKITSKKRK